MKISVIYKKDKTYEGQESWRIIANGQDIGCIIRPTSATRVYAEINNKEVYKNGFDNIRTAKMYIKDFIGDYI